MNRPYFNNIRKEIINVLDNAKQSVMVAMAWFTNDEIFEALLSCRKRNVEVSLILMDDMINHADFGVDFNKFIDAGGHFYLFFKDIKMMHNKFCIIDHEVTITGSYNWTNYAEIRNCENIIISKETEIARKYVEEFDRLLSSASVCNHFDILDINDIDANVFMTRYKDFSEEVYCLPESKKQAVFVFESKRQECGIVVPTIVGNSEKLRNSAQTTINVVEDHQCPVSKYNIGFKAYLKEKNDVGLKLMVLKGTELPYTISRDAWNNNDNTQSMECEFYYGATDTLSSCKQFARLEVTDLPLLKSGEVKFKTNITIDTNGYVRVEFVCVNTGKGKDATCINKDFVEYVKK